MKTIITWLNNNQDKVQHFLIGYFIATILPIPIIYGLILAIIAGAIKEYFDSKGNGNVDFNDFLATVLGGLIGYTAMIIK